MFSSFPFFSIGNTPFFQESFVFQQLFFLRMIHFSGDHYYFRSSISISAFCLFLTYSKLNFLTKFQTILNKLIIKANYVKNGPKSKRILVNYSNYSIFFFFLVFNSNYQFGDSFLHKLYQYS